MIKYLAKLRCETYLSNIDNKHIDYVYEPGSLVLVFAPTIVLNKYSHCGTFLAYPLVSYLRGSPIFSDKYCKDKCSSVDLEHIDLYYPKNMDIVDKYTLNRVEARTTNGKTSYTYFDAKGNIREKPKKSRYDGFVFLRNEAPAIDLNELAQGIQRGPNAGEAPPVAPAPQPNNDRGGQGEPGYVDRGYLIRAIEALDRGGN